MIFKIAVVLIFILNLLLLNRSNLNLLKELLVHLQVQTLNLKVYFNTYISSEKYFFNVE